jgi:NifU-like protein involved in Fe-S cluster formation
MKYSTELLHYFDHTEHAGTITKADNVTIVTQGLSDNQEVIELSLQWNHNTISQARFRAYGTPALIAAAQWLCQWLEGKSLSDAIRLDRSQILHALLLSPVQVHVAQLLCSAVTSCLKNHQKDAIASCE